MFPEAAQNFLGAIARSSVFVKLVQESVWHLDNLGFAKVESVRD
jgi:hypothetical protein